MTTFNLPDLGEGLQEAEIVAWHIKEGDDVKVDQLMVSVETAKAVVEVPSPYQGKVTRLLVKAGEVVATNQSIVEFDLGKSEPKQAPAVTQAHSNSHSTPSSMTVVGRMNVSDADWQEQAQVAVAARRSTTSNRLRAAPAVRMVAKRLNVDLKTVRATGKHGLITLDDVLAHTGLTRQGSRIANYTMPTLGERLAGEFDVITGARKSMAQSMTQSRDEIAMVTVFDDADIHNWSGRVDMTARIIRALCKGVTVEPAVNALFDPNGPARRLFNHVDLGIAIDVGDKLFVPVIRDAHNKSMLEVREELNRLKQAAKDRTLAPEEFRDYTITLTNFGTLAGRYATPMVVPPTVAILGSGKVHRDVVATDTGDIEVHSRIPLSLSFDHRALTGGEAVRFLGAVIKDLELKD